MVPSFWIFYIHLSIWSLTKVHEFSMLSNGNCDYVTELYFVFGDIVNLCCLLEQKGSILINHYILFANSYSQFLNLYFISPQNIKS